MNLLEIKETYVAAGGYECVTLGGNNYYVHRLIAEQNIPNPANKTCINHMDGNKLNNEVGNLEWCSYSENAKHAYKIGLRHGHFPRPARRKPIKAVKGGVVLTFSSTGEASEATGVLGTAINNNLCGRSSHAGGYQWSRC